MNVYTYPHGNLGVDCATVEGQDGIERYESILERLLNEAFPGEDWIVRGEHAEGSRSRLEDDIEDVTAAAWAEFCES